MATPFFMGFFSGANVVFGLVSLSSGNTLTALIQFGIAGGLYYVDQAGTLKDKENK